LLVLEDVKPPSQAERQIRSFRNYLCDMRGFAPSTVLGNISRISIFFQFLKFDEQPSALCKLNRDQIDAFLCQAAKTNNRFSLQHIVATLRTFLRWLHAEGALPKPLHHQIDTPRTYRLEQLPRALPWEQISQLLRSIDCSTSHGLRDFTLLY
jgi:site-specific recombinase XerD